MAELSSNPFLQKLQTTPHQDRIKPIKKDGVGGKKDQLMADRDAYMALLLTQLKNQNPQSPADTNQMTQNIVAISQAEQAITTNEHLEKLVTMQEHAHKSSIVSYIGKEVEYDNSKQSLEFGQASFTYELPKDAETLKVNIVDAKGHLIRSLGSDRNMRAKGVHQFDWDGKDNNGRMQKEGVYQIQIDAATENGTPIAANTAVRAKVEGVIEDYAGNFELVLNNRNKIGINRLSGIFAAPEMKKDERAGQVDLSKLMESMNNFNINE
ncbi:MAG: hypothetical protein J0G32_07560 [Alphaproteobacteria bacterium]|nr:hypothetical protein [Alphaproteobacteria bacterium]OJV12156.1 MAG: hypothetical protein BGO27_05400 [Alphaproteobacteria bacterium 33-17]